MATTIQLLRSDVLQQRPTPGVLANAVPMVNIHETEPGLFFAARDGSLFKVGPASVSDSQPNLFPAGSTGNCLGELWVDTSGTNPDLKFFNGTEFKSAFTAPTAVTSVALDLPNIFTVTGSPVTTSGTLRADLSSQTINTVFAAPPSGDSGPPSFRSLVENDIPSISASKITSGVLSSDRIPNFSASKIDSGVLAADRIPNISADKITGGTLPHTRGGTGYSTNPTNGQLLIGDGSGWQIAKLTAGDNISVTNGSGSITVAVDDEPLLSSVRLKGSGSNSLTLNAAGAGLYTLTLPPSDGTSGSVLTTNGSGQLSFETSISGFNSVSADTLVSDNAYTVSTLPGPYAGQIARVTDATTPSIGSAVVGGGSAAALCWYNGTTWTVIGV